MQDIWVAFISDPVKGLPDLGWKTYEPGGIEFGTDGKLAGSIGFDELGSVCNVSETVLGSLPP